METLVEHLRCLLGPSRNEWDDERQAIESLAENLQALPVSGSQTRLIRLSSDFTSELRNSIDSKSLGDQKSQLHTLWQLMVEMTNEAPVVTKKEKAGQDREIWIAAELLANLLGELGAGLPRRNLSGHTIHMPWLDRNKRFEMELRSLGDNDKDARKKELLKLVLRRHELAADRASRSNDGRWDATRAVRNNMGVGSGSHEEHVQLQIIFELAKDLSDPSKARNSQSRRISYVGRLIWEQLRSSASLQERKERRMRQVMTMHAFVDDLSLEQQAKGMIADYEQLKDKLETRSLSDERRRDSDHHVGKPKAMTYEEAEEISKRHLLERFPELKGWEADFADYERCVEEHELNMAVWERVQKRIRRVDPRRRAEADREIARIRAEAEPWFHLGKGNESPERARRRAQKEAERKADEEVRIRNERRQRNE